MLGVLHRTMLGLGPPHYKKFFPKQHGAKVFDNPYAYAPFAIGPWRKQLPFIKHSALGLIPVYNSLDLETRSLRSVPEFQSALTAYVKNLIHLGMVEWDSCYCPRKWGT